MTETARTGAAMDIKVTPAMIEAGNQMAADLHDASVSASLDGLGGCKTVAEWVETKDVQNKDLILLYMEQKIVSVTAFYMAMERARIQEQTQSAPVVRMGIQICPVCGLQFEHPITQTRLEPILRHCRPPFGDSDEPLSGVHSMPEVCPCSEQLVWVRDPQNKE